MSRALTRPSQNKKYSLAMSLEVALLKLFHGRKLAEIYMIMDKENLETIWNIEQKRGNPCVDIIRRKPLSTIVGRLTTDAAVLRRADEEARQAVFGYLDWQMRMSYLPARINWTEVGQNSCPGEDTSACS